MTLRDKAKSLFKRRASRDDTLSKSYSKESHERWLSNVYQPGEPMPRPKYRRPPEKAHKAKLDAFSFAEAWRKKSFQSQHSPMGTRQPSRRNSFVSTKRRSIAARSSLSRNASVDSQSADKSGVKHKDALGAARAPKLSTEAEEEGDGDVGNVGSSQVQNRENNHPPPRSHTVDEKPYTRPIASLPSLNTAHDHQPFSEDELSLAMKRSHLAVPAQ